MHEKPLLQDLKAEAAGENCIKITVDTDLNLDGACLKILGASRNLLVTIKPVNPVNEICLSTGNPMFVELVTPCGISVQYVKGSGKNFYIQSLN
jgi:hypothetical protein